MTQDSKGLIVTWEKISLKEKTFIPKIGEHVKTLLLQHFLIVFNYLGGPLDLIIAFDLKEKEWLRMKIRGDLLTLREESSVCRYDNQAVILFGNDGKEDILSILSFKKVFNEMHVYHDLIRLQDRILKSRHSANIYEDRMFLYGGCTKGSFNDDLSAVDLSKLIVTSILNQKETLEVTPKINFSGPSPGKLISHSSISKGNKVYIFEGKDEKGVLNQNVFLFDLKAFSCLVIKPPEKIHGTVQIHEETIYMFRGNRDSLNSFLSIYDTSKNYRYEIVRRGDIPPASYGGLSTIYDNKMFFLGGFVENKYSYVRETGQIYSFNLDLKPANDFIKEVVLKRTLGFEEESKDLEALQKVQKLLSENKDHDIIFKIQEKEIPAHKNILSIRSSYFSNMFSSGMQESHSKEIVLSDISAQAFEAFLEYLYKGTLPSNEAILKELIVYSEKILLKKLRLHCERALINLITKENAIELYELSKISEAEELREASIQFMHNHFSYFVDQFASILAKQPEQKN